MKRLIFDSGPIITLTMNGLLWMLDPLREKFDGQFVITDKVKSELVDRPMHIKRFKFEALKVLRQISEKNLQILIDERVDVKTELLLNLANKIYVAKGHPIKLIHPAEMQVVAAGVVLGADALVIDERSMRQIIEDPLQLKEHMQAKLHTHIKIDEKALAQFQEEVKGLKIIRSFELIVMAFELGILDRYVTHDEAHFVPNIRMELLDAALWSAKLNGCAVTEREIKRTMVLEDDRQN